MWLKLDVKVPFDHENDTVPASGEVEFGKMLTKGVGLFVKGLGGIGGERPFDWGVGTGVRISF